MRVLIPNPSKTRQLAPRKTIEQPDRGGNPWEHIGSPLLRRCAERLAGRLPRELRDSGGELEDVRQLLAEAATAVSEQRVHGTLPSSTRLKSALSRRLLELLRAEVTGELAAATPPPSVEEVLAFDKAFEGVRTALEPNWDEYFAQRLAGPDGVEMVVEVAHDLRSPLTSILFLAETIQRGHSGPVSDLQHRQMGLIYSAALGLSTLVSNVIELARGGSRLTDDRPTPFSVSEIFESVYDIVQPMAEEKGLTVRLFPPPSDHRIGHPQALSRILLNLTTNAIKFTEDGFVELVGRATSLSRVEFSVRDTGSGITENSLKTLYLPFRRSPRQDRFAFSGTGLGLALSRKLVEVLGSELRVETRPNWGSRFYFEIELALQRVSDPVGGSPQ